MNFPSWSISSEWFAYLLFPITRVYPDLARVVPTFIGGLALARLLPPASLDSAIWRTVPVVLLVFALVWPFFAPNDSLKDSVYIATFFVFVATFGGAETGASLSGDRGLSRIWGTSPIPRT